MSAFRHGARRLGVRGGFLVAVLSGCSPAAPGGGAGGGAAQPDASSSSSSASSASTGEGGAGPIACDAAYTDVPGGDCDLLQQDCPAGATCIPVEEREAEWAARCFEATGIKGAGKACTAPAECEAGLFCIGGPNARCTSPCCPSSGEPCGNGLCNLKVNFGGAFLWMCSYNRRCELFAEDACDPGEACHISDPQQGLATCVRADGDQVDEGQPCAYLNQCKDMQHCDASEMGTCRYYCYLEPQGDLAPGRGGCPDGQGCVEIDFGVPGVGLCKPL